MECLPLRLMACVPFWALRENADAAADADDGCRRLHRDRALMAELAADILQRALRQFGQHVAAIGSGIVDELVDHQTGIRRNTQGAFVEKQTATLEVPVRYC